MNIKLHVLQRFLSQQTLVFILFSCVFFRRSLGKRSKRRNFPTVKTEKNSNLLALLAYNTLACVARAKGKGKGGGGATKYEGKRKGEDGGLGRREGKGALAATLLFSSVRLLSHYPIKMKRNWFVYFCFRVNCLTSAICTRAGFSSRWSIHKCQ